LVAISRKLWYYLLIIIRFGKINKDFFLKGIKGHGYVETRISTIGESYTSLVPKGYGFLKEIKEAWQNNEQKSYSND